MRNKKLVAAIVILVVILGVLISQRSRYVAPVGPTDSAVSSPESQKDSARLVLSVGKTLTYKNLSLKLVSIISDSRCPSDVTCVRAGEILVRLELAEDDLHDTFDLRDVDPVQGFGDYDLKIESVSPSRKAGETIADKDYRVVVRVTK